MISHRSTRSTFASAAVLLLVSAVSGQEPTPTPSATVSGERFTVTSSVEVGARALDINGSREKFRSDLNFKSGFRVFDSSIFVEDSGEGYKVFDSALIISSGWGADPSGFLRVNMERSRIYRLDANVRRVSFFNDLNNHALSQHDADTRRSFADLDLIVFPERPDLRFRLGYSLNTIRGNGGYNTRAYSDEFPVSSFVSSTSNDFRSGVDGRLLGFNMTLTYGWRSFNDRTSYRLLAPDLGNNPTNNARLFTFDRRNPSYGDTHYGLLSVQRTVAKRFDFTARLLYSASDTDFSLFESITGRDNSNNQVDLDRIEINGQTKRPQARGDLGLTFLVTDKFRISNTFTFDRFNITGGNLYAQGFYRRSAAGAPLATVFTNTFSHRITSFRRAVNTVEADYQFSDRLGFNVGYRFTHRDIALEFFDRNFAQANPTVSSEEFNNTTHTALAGMKLKPMRNWAIFWDLEHGRADNVFTRLANSKFTNFRVRSRMSFQKVAFNLSAIVRNNETPSRDVEDPPRDFSADSRSQTYSAVLDWYPANEFNLSGGYTYQHLNSETAVIVPVSGQRLQGVSQFFVRDHYGFIEVTARPVKRLTIFGSYRFNDDRGQGDLTSAVPQNIITSYPMKFHSPEVRLSVRLNSHIDWNIGYQYFNYKERFQTLQDYRAHLPYTSLRIYFGKSAAER